MNRIPGFLTVKKEVVKFSAEGCHLYLIPRKPGFSAPLRKITR